MRYLLDTNVVSELRKRERSNTALRRWFEAVAEDELALSVLVLGELHLGVLRLHRRDPDAAEHLLMWLTRIERSYAGRILPLDEPVVRVWAKFNASRPLPVIDSLLAATAAVHGLILVTRNVRDLEGVPITLLDPFA